MSKFSLIAMIIFILLFTTRFALAIELTELREIYMEGVQALANSDLTKAEENFKTIISIPDTSGLDSQNRYIAKSYYFLGDVYFIKKDYIKAIEYYQKIIQEYSDVDIYPRAMYRLGRTLVMNEQYGQGIAILNNYLGNYKNIDSLEDNALYWVGRAYAGMKDYLMAISAFQNILTKYPTTALAYDIRKSIEQLREIVEKEREEERKITNIINEIESLRERNLQLQREKETLEKISQLLLIKQRLLEIKSKKVEILASIRANREAR